MKKVVWLVVEDELSERVVRQILAQSSSGFEVGSCSRPGGFTYLKKNIRAFNRAARGMPILVLTDLDRGECAPRLIRDWLPDPIHANLMLRVAEREIESWIMADRAALAGFLRVPLHRIPEQTDGIAEPKEFLVQLARKSRTRDIRSALVPPGNTGARVGRDYNGKLSAFVDGHWKLEAAIPHSRSLSKMIRALQRYDPCW